MSNTVISVENLSKSYQLGIINTGTFYGDLNRRWAKLRGLPDPYLKFGEKDHGNRQGETLWALKDINFQVQQGEVLGIIGRNGAGKSTLLKVLSRVTAPTSGEVKVKGRIASLLEVGTGFHPELTGRENIFLNGAIMGMDRREIQRKFDEILDFSGVEKFIDTPVKRYSSGMYVRLAFAVAAHLEPDILIVDEVLAVGDAEFQKRCFGKMSDVAHQGRTVLFVSHNMAAVRNLCPTGILFEQGRLKFIGSIDDTVSKYLTELDEKEAQINLASRKDREGDRSVRVTGIQLRNLEYENGLPTTGSRIEFVVEYESKQQIQISKLFVAITIRDGFGTNLFTCSTSMKKTDFFNIAAHGYAICRVEYLPLITGHYSLSIKLSNDNVVADYITNATGFEVVEGGSSGFVNYASPSWGSIVVPHEWRLEPCE